MGIGVQKWGGWRGQGCEESRESEELHKTTRGGISKSGILLTKIPMLEEVWRGGGRVSSFANKKIFMKGGGPRERGRRSQTVKSRARLRNPESRGERFGNAKSKN